MKEIISKYNKSTVKNIIDAGIINQHWDFLDKTKRYIVITDKNLSTIYADTLEKIPNLQTILELKPGEKSKTLATYQKIVAALIKLHIKKEDILIAFGGGTITDLTAFVASTYQRGIQFISIPTSLVSQVNASIGGKCGINFNGNNNIGSYYHPSLIVTDTELLKSLPQIEFEKGMVEIIKYAMIKDEKLYYQISNDLISAHHPNLEEIITKSIKIKTSLCEKDEYDIDQRKLLNYGHTYGNIINRLSKGKISYQHSIALGMYYELDDIDIKDNFIRTLNKYNLGLNLEKYNINYAKQIAKEKKITNKEITLIHIDKIGKGRIMLK